MPASGPQGQDEGRQQPYGDIGWDATPDDFHMLTPDNQHLPVPPNNQHVPVAPDDGHAPVTPDDRHVAVAPDDTAATPDNWPVP